MDGFDQPATRRDVEQLREDLFAVREALRRHMDVTAQRLISETRLSLRGLAVVGRGP